MHISVSPYNTNTVSLRKDESGLPWADYEFDHDVESQLAQSVAAPLALLLPWEQAASHHKIEEHRVGLVLSILL